MKKIKRRFTLKKVGKLLLKNLVLLIIGFTYTMLWILDSLNKKVAKEFAKLPYKLKVALIYSLVLSLVPNVINFVNFAKENDLFVKVETQIVEVVKVVEVEKETSKTEKVEEVAKKEIRTFDTKIENLIYTKALEVGLTEDQALIALAISKHETGKWTSNLYKNHNNIGGIYNSSKQEFYSYETREEGVEAFVNLLKKGYFDKGYITIKKIQKKYCPIGAKNDPNNINQYWVSGVTHYYEQYTA